MVFAASCTKLDEGIDIVQTEQKQKTKFDILVTRDGQVVSKERTGIMTKAGVDSGDMNATMDEDIPFGLIGIDFEHNRLLVDNARVDSDMQGYSTYFDWYSWGNAGKVNNFYYEPIKNQVRKYMLYGLLPDNVFEYGKQYTFHIGLDLSGVYREITFAPAVADWETTIYENNDDF